MRQHMAAFVNTQANGGTCGFFAVHKECPRTLYSAQKVNVRFCGSINLLVFRSELASDLSPNGTPWKLRGLLSRHHQKTNPMVFQWYFMVFHCISRVFHCISMVFQWYFIVFHSISQVFQWYFIGISWFFNAIPPPVHPKCHRVDFEY